METGRQKLWLLTAAFFLLTLHLPLKAETAMPSPEELIALAPRISLEDADISSFEVTGTIDGGGIRLRFIVSAQRPGQYAVAIIDPTDNTPIVVATQALLTYYDPLAGQVMVLSPMQPTFQMMVNKKQAAEPKVPQADNSNSLSFGIGFGSRDTNNPDEVVIDIHSLMAAGKVSYDTRASGNGRIVLEGRTEAGSTVLAHIEKTRQDGPYERIELTPAAAGGGKPWLILDRIQINRPIPPRRFTFPKAALEASGLPIKANSVGDSDSEAFDTMKSLAAALAARAVMRGLLEDTELKLTDAEWKQLETGDKKISAALRDVFAEQIAPLPPR